MSQARTDEEVDSMKTVLSELSERLEQVEITFAEQNIENENVMNTIKVIEVNVDSPVSHTAADISSTQHPDLSKFDPMQKGLYAQFGGMLRKLQPHQRPKRLSDLKQNLSGQPE